MSDENNQNKQSVNSDDLCGLTYDIYNDGQESIPKHIENPESVAVIILSAAVTIAKDGRLMFAYHVGDSVGKDVKMSADVFAYAFKESLDQHAKAFFDGFSEAWKHYEERG